MVTTGNDFIKNQQTAYIPVNKKVTPQVFVCANGEVNLCKISAANESGLCTTSQLFHVETYQDKRQMNLQKVKK